MLGLFDPRLTFVIHVKKIQLKSKAKCCSNRLCSEHIYVKVITHCKHASLLYDNEITSLIDIYFLRISFIPSEPF